MEVYKTCLDSLGPWLHRVITNVWLFEAVPNNWSEAARLPLFNKGEYANMGGSEYALIIGTSV